jgi:hypothetical protein
MTNPSTSPTTSPRPYDPRSAAGVSRGTGSTQPDPSVSERPNGVDPRFTSGKRRDPRKQTIEHQAGFLTLMVQKFAKRAAAEDPGYGLRALLKIQATVNAAVNEVGRELVDQIGPAAVADDLSQGGDGAWSRQRVHKRWGPHADRESA